MLPAQGPECGYTPQPSQCCVVVAAPSLSLANEAFDGLGVRLASGNRFLGGFLGGTAEIQDLVLQKVRRWCAHVWLLAAVSISQPQAVFSA